MASFLTAVALTLQNEGGYVDDPEDPGGATNMGITQKDMPGVNLRHLAEWQAREYYADHYWNPEYDHVVSQAVANKLFDMGVLFGVGTAVKMFQRALGAVKVDGEFGPKTTLRTNDLVDTTGADGLLARFRSNLESYVDGLCRGSHQLYKFERGWLNRINS